jgi:hypothetical protein
MMSAGVVRFTVPPLGYHLVRDGGCYASCATRDRSRTVLTDNVSVDYHTRGNRRTFLTSYVYLAGY